MSTASDAPTEPRGEIAILQRPEPMALSLSETMSIAETFFKSALFGDVRSVAQAVVKVLAGRELGLGPFAAMGGMQVIQGKVQAGANILAGLVKRSGRYDYRVRQLDHTACVLEFFENGKSAGVSSFTVEDARKAGTKNLDKYPRNMLFARAISNGVKWFCPDVQNGATIYAPGEIAEESADDPGMVEPAALPPAASPAPPPPSSRRPAGTNGHAALTPKLAEIKRVRDLLGIDPETWENVILAKRNVVTARQLTEAQQDELLAALQKKLAATSQTLPEALADADSKSEAVEPPY